MGHDGQLPVAGIDVLLEARRRDKNYMELWNDRDL